MMRVIIINQEMDAESPRDYSDTLGTISAFKSGESFNQSSLTYEETKGLPNNKEYIAVPVYIYEHGETAVSTTPFACQFDSYQLGYIYVTKDKARKELAIKKLTAKRIEEIKGYLEQEIKHLQLYLEEGAWYFELYENEVQVESCGGFYGRDPLTNGMIESIGKEKFETSHIIMEDR